MGPEPEGPGDRAPDPREVGETLRREAEASTRKVASAEFGAWSIVVSAPGFLGGIVGEWMLTVKRLPGSAEAAESERHDLRQVVRGAGGPADAEPEEAILGTLMWRWDRGPAAGRAAARGGAAAGRNDPCPCGSGKKFKKCCLA